MDLDTLAAELHAAYVCYSLRRNPKSAVIVQFAELADYVQEGYRAVARRALELLGNARTIIVGIK